MTACIVTNEYPVISKSGGIGTFAQQIGLNCHIDGGIEILFTGDSNQEFEEMQIGKQNKLLHLSSLQPIRKFSGGSHYLHAKSLQAYDYLKNRNYRHIHFVDYLGLGFASVQAKKMGIAFKDTLLSISLHGVSDWARNDEGSFEAFDFQREILRYMEEYCLRNVDLVVSPSHYMKNWVEERLDLDTRNLTVIPNPYRESVSKIPVSNQESGVMTKKYSLKNIVFFGRVEKRKGIESFLSAANLISESFAEEINFHVIGSRTAHYDPFAQYDQENWMRNLRLHENLTSQEAIKFIKDKSALVIVPSLIENFPYVAQELSGKGIRAVLSNVGGIPEICPSSNLIIGDTESIAETIGSFIDDEESIPFLDSILDTDSIISKWDTFLAQTASLKSIQSKSTSHIGIVITHYNQSAYIEQTISSVISQTYKNFSCLVIDDGSTQTHRQKFIEIVESFSDQRLTIRLQENLDVGRSRNIGVSLLDVDYVTFLDGDDILEPHAIENMVTALDSGVDISTSHFSTFLDDEKIYRVSGSYEPIGPVKRVAWYRNILGGANLAIRKKVFLELGGFNEERKATHHDWQLLTKASLKNFKVDVIPERLLRYRVIMDSMSRQRSHALGQSRVISTFVEFSYPEDLRSLAEKLMTSKMIDALQPNSFQLHSSTEILVRKIQKFALKVCPFGSLRWKLALRVYRFIAR